MKSSMGLLAKLNSISSAVRGGQASFKYRSSGKRFPGCGSRAADRQKRQGLRNVMVNGFMLIQKA